MRFRLLTVVAVLGTIQAFAGPSRPPLPTPSEPSAPAAGSEVKTLLQRADAAQQAGTAGEALRFAREAAQLARSRGELAGEAHSSAAIARLLEAGGDATAGHAWEEAATAWRRVGDGPGEVEALCRQALLAPPAPLDAAARLLRAVVQRARAEQRRPAAMSEQLDIAATDLFERGRFPEAERLWEAGLFLDERRAAGSRLWEAGLFLDERRRRVLDVASDLNNLGAVAAEQGEFGRAGGYHQRALAIRMRLKPGSPLVATSWNNLGFIALEQGDLAAARQYQERGLAIDLKLAPEALPTAFSLNNLGVLLIRKGDLDGAEKYHLQALRIRQKLAPGSPAVAQSYNNLGFIARQRGDFTAARDDYAQALRIYETRAPDSLAFSATLNNLGALAAKERDWRAARDFHERSLLIRQRLARGSLLEARSLNDLAAVARGEGRLEEAERLAASAWELVLRRSLDVAGDEARQAFDSSTYGYAASLVEYRVELGRPDEAFRVVEESRAQSLRRLLSERSLALHLAAPELASRYTQARAASSRAGEALAAARAAAARGPVLAPGGAIAPTPAPATDTQQSLLSARLQQAENAYAAARVTMENAWAALESDLVRRRGGRLDVGAVDPEQARRSLPDGTLYLSFSVGEERTLVFAAVRSVEVPVRVFRANLTGNELARRVRELREALEAEAGGPAALRAVRLQRVSQTSRALSQVLFSPEAREAIRHARRIVFSPDGPLWDLPFAALSLQEAAAGASYLGLAKPLTYSPSLALHTAGLRQMERQPAPRGKLPALVLGNPALRRESRPGTQAAVPKPRPGPVRLSASPLSFESSAKEPLRAFTVGGVIPVPLPRAAEEAREIARLYGTEPALGALPTEAWFRRHAPGKQVLHLATHGYFNRYRAMSSALALAAPQALTEKRAAGTAVTEDDGVLQAWELVSMKLPAELAVLSACETAQGEKVQGEGLVGLTRALQVAGVRSVVASQWAVKEGSTKALMVAFHRGLRAGLPKDEALQQAMQSVAKQAGWENPYYWSAFLLTGDPRNGGLAAPHR
jgi:CHAT domain-containing protein/Tfp pilus assembly protein PilF